jgi:hypothetical protein
MSGKWFTNRGQVIQTVVAIISACLALVALYFVLKSNNSLPKASAILYVSGATFFLLVGVLIGHAQAVVQAGNAGILRSRAGEARGLLEKLEEVWHLYNDDRHQPEGSLTYPLAVEAIPEEIKEFRHKRLVEFRTIYRWHIASIKRTFPDFHSDVVDDGFPSKVPYLTLKRNIEAHVGLLEAEAQKLRSFRTKRE